jgi:hypothetical protein
MMEIHNISEEDDGIVNITMGGEGDYEQSRYQVTKLEPVRIQSKQHRYQGI